MTGTQPIPMPFCNSKSVSDICSAHSGARTKTPSVQETVLPLHSEPEPTPTTLMGLQSSPRRTSTPETATPSRPRRAEPSLELAYMSYPWAMSATTSAIRTTGSTHGDGALAALRVSISTGGWRGGRKKGEREHGERDEAGEHLVCCLQRLRTRKR